MEIEISKLENNFELIDVKKGENKDIEFKFIKKYLISILNINVKIILGIY